MTINATNKKQILVKFNMHNVFPFPLLSLQKWNEPKKKNHISMCYTSVQLISKIFW